MTCLVPNADHDGYEHIDHDLEADPRHRGEGLACAACGVTEADLSGDHHDYADDERYQR